MILAEHQTYCVAFKLDTDAWAQQLEPGEFASTNLSHDNAEYLCVTAIASTCAHMDAASIEACPDHPELTSGDDAQLMVKAVKGAWTMAATEGFTCPVPDLPASDGWIVAVITNDRFRVDHSDDTAEAQR